MRQSRRPYLLNLAAKRGALHARWHVQTHGRPFRGRGEIWSHLDLDRVPIRIGDPESVGIATCRGCDKRCTRPDSLLPKWFQILFEASKAQKGQLLREPGNILAQTCSLPEPRTIMLLMPITSPAKLTNGPPELP